MERTPRRYIVATVLVVAIVALALLFGLRAGQADDLAGSSWQLTALGESPALSAGEPVSLSFQDDGHVGGNSGCNGYGGEYSVSGDSLAISNLISTMRACADNALNAQESAYFAALTEVDSYELAGGQLTLSDADGNAALVFAARP